MMQEGRKQIMRKRFSGIRHRLHDRARKACSILLCTSLIAGGMPVTALTAYAAADDNEADYIYETDGISFAEAIQEAVSEGNYLEQKPIFLGEAADEYSELFEPDGTLYELNYDTLNIEKDKERDKNLSLSIFARITEDIPLDETYMIDGEEDIIFLLQNRSDDEATVTIYVDEKESEIIIVPAGDDIEVDTGSVVKDIDDKPASADTRSLTGGTQVKGAGGNTTAGGNKGKASSNTENSVNANDDVNNNDADDESDKAIPDIKIDIDSSDQSESDNNFIDSDVKPDKDTGSDIKGDRSDTEKHSRNGVTDKDHDNNDENESDPVKNNENKEKSDNIDSSEYSGSDKDSRSKGERSYDDENYGDKKDLGGKSASVSSHKTNPLTASIASDSDTVKATPSDASSVLNGTVFDPVRIGKQGAVAFVTTAEDLGLEIETDSYIEKTNTEIYSMTLDSLCDAVEKEVREGNLLEETENGYLYEIFPTLEDEAEAVTLRTFVEINNINDTTGADDEISEEPESEGSPETIESADSSVYSVTGEEEIYFLLINEADDEVRIRIQISTSDEIYETPVIVIAQTEEELLIEALSDNAYDDNCIVMEGDLYDASEVENKPAMAYATILQNLGIDYGIRTLSTFDVYTEAELQKAIQNAGEGDIIYLRADISVSTSGGNRFTVANSGITVDLGGYTITAAGPNSSYNVFYVTCDGKFTLQNGTIDGGLGEGDEKIASAQCQAVKTSGSSEIILDNITIEYFASSNGAVQLSGGTATIKNSNIQNNSTHGINGSNVDLTIENSNIIENTSSSASTTHGAGIYIKGGNLTVNESKINNNTSTRYGGGLYMEGSTVSINNSEFSGNTAGQQGGGICFSTVTSNIQLENNNFSGNAASSTGGGIMMSECSCIINIVNNKVENNSAFGNGGGIYIENYSYDTGDITIKGNAIISNIVKPTSANSNRSYGGGISIINGCGFYNVPSNTSCIFVDNEIIGNEAAQYDDETGEGRGGGISLANFDSDAEFIIESGTFSGNEASWGGAIDYTYHSAATLYLYDALITQNDAVRGGGIWECPTAVTNMYQTFGGAIYENSATGSFTWGSENVPSTGDDIRYEASDSDIVGLLNTDPEAMESSYSTVSSRAMGGRMIDWYADDLTRYKVGDSKVDVKIDYNRRKTTFGLHSELDEKGKELAQNDAKVIISGNSATMFGGGIASNSWIDFGGSEDEYPLLDITVNKIWHDSDDTLLPEEEIENYSVDITLVREVEGMESDEIETATLNKENDWTCKFIDLPMYYIKDDLSEVRCTYTVKETGINADGNFKVEVVSGEATLNEDQTSFTQEITVTNIKTIDLEIGKQVQGSDNSQHESDFKFKITLTDPEYNLYEGDINVSYYSKDSDGNRVDERDDILTFTNGEAEITLSADKYISLALSKGINWEVEELTDDTGQTYISLNGSVTKAKATSGTIADSTQVIFINSFREYFDIDEEIIPNMDDAEHRETWEKNESVTEYGALEFEMSTFLPVVVPEDVAYGDFTMLFHNKLDEGLLLDANEEEDLHITIAGKDVPSDYYTVEILTKDEWTIAPLALVDNEDCTFHVTVDLTRLYNETDIVNDDDLLSGETEIIIFFYVDLEGQSMDGSYKSTVQYQIFDEEELLYTSSESVVYVYTYEIGINKSNSANGRALSGATFGVYYDEACTQPVMRYGENYTVTSDENGQVLFYGLAAGTYYLKEIEAPTGFVLTQDVYKVIVGEEQVNISASTDMTKDDLDGAVFGVFYDEECTQQVSVDGIYYTVTSDSNGNIIFDGIAAGTYYLKQLEAPEGRELSTDVIKVTLDYDTFTYGYDLTVSNTPTSTNSSGRSGSGGGGGSSSGSPGIVVNPGSPEEDTDSWDLLPMPPTGEGRALLFGGLVLVVSAVALIVLLFYKRRESER